MTNTGLSAVAVGAMATVDATSGRIYIKDLPETGSDSEGWRFTLKSQNLRVAPDPVAAMAYIREPDDEAVSFGDLASNFFQTCMNKTDVNAGDPQADTITCIVWLWSSGCLHR